MANIQNKADKEMSYMLKTQKIANKKKYKKEQLQQIADKCALQVQQKKLKQNEEYQRKLDREKNELLVLSEQTNLKSTRKKRLPEVFKAGVKGRVLAWATKNLRKS